MLHDTSMQMPHKSGHCCNASNPLVRPVSISSSTPSAAGETPIAANQSAQVLNILAFSDSALDLWQWVPKIHPQSQLMICSNIEGLASLGAICQAQQYCCVSTNVNPMPSEGQPGCVGSQMSVQGTPDSICLQSEFAKARVLLP